MSARAAATQLEEALCAIVADRQHDDELRRSRTLALQISASVARDRADACGTHPGADAIIATAREFFDFIWSGA